MTGSGLRLPCSLAPEAPAWSPPGELAAPSHGQALVWAPRGSGIAGVGRPGCGHRVPLANAAPGGRRLPSAPLSARCAGPDSPWHAVGAQCDGGPRSCSASGSPASPGAPGGRGSGPPLSEPSGMPERWKTLGGVGPERPALTRAGACSAGGGPRAHRPAFELGRGEAAGRGPSGRAVSLLQLLLPAQEKRRPQAQRQAEGGQGSQGAQGAGRTGNRCAGGWRGRVWSG